MSETLVLALPYISAAASAVQMVSSIAGGKQGSNSAALQAQQLEDERRNAATQAKIDEAERRKELASVLATNQAVRAGRGIELYSDTFNNLQDVAVRDAETDIGMIQLNSLNRQRRLGLGIEQANAQGASAELAGLGGAAGATGGLLKAGAEIFKKKGP